MDAVPPALRGPMNPLDEPLPPHWQESDDEGVSLWELWDIAWAGKWWVIALALGCGALGAGWASFQTPWYQSKVVLMSLDQTPVAGSTASASQDAQSAGSSRLFASPAVPLVTLQSARFAENFILKHDLMRVLFAEDWDAEAQRWNVDDPADAPDLRDAVSLFTSDVLSVHADPRSGLTTLSVSWSDAELARTWADGLVTDLNQTLRAQALADAERNVEHLKSEMPKATSATVQQSIGRLLDIEMQKVMLVKVHPDVAYTVIDPARTPKDPFKPQPLRITLMALVAGALAGLMLVFLRNAASARRKQRAFDLASGDGPADDSGAGPRLPALRPTGPSGLKSLR